MEQQNKIEKRKLINQRRKERLQEHKDALQLAEWRKNPPCAKVCEYLDKN